MSVFLVSDKVVNTKIKPHIQNFLEKSEEKKFQKLGGNYKSDWLAGRIGLKYAFQKYHQTYNIRKKASQIKVKNYPSGVPFVSGFGNLHYSISHSYGWGIGAVSSTKIGVDIEKLRPHCSYLLKFIADIDEIRTVKNYFGKKTDIVTLVWTAKESVMKGLGEGLNLTPSSVKIKKLVSGNYFEVLTPDLESPLWQVWAFKTNHFYVSIAYENFKEFEPELSRYNRSFIPASERKINFARIGA